ncbi:MAG TPA: ABC transporter ATP-binding protein [Saprospiraceae bacterium]|nr:ABC transporter ATP-binding protein [Saprospiraceae bacterium]
MAKSKKDFYILLRVMRLANPYKQILILAAVLAILLAPLATLRPYLVQKMTDNYIASKDLMGMNKMVMILFGLLIIEAIFGYAFNYSTSWLGANAVRDLRAKVFETITSLRLRYFDTTPVGNSTTRTINDIETINSIFSEGIITIIADILTLVTVLGMMFYTSWKLTLVCMTTLPFLLVASYIFKEKVKVSFQRVRAEIAKMNSFLQERITGMKVVQIFNAEDSDKQKYKVINREYTQANLDSILYYAVFFPVVEIISAASLGLMVWYGAKGVLHGTITMGVMVAFPIYISMLFRPIRMLADKFNTLQMGLVAAERVFNIMDDAVLKEESGTLVKDRFEGKVEFRNVTFAYNNNDHVLKDLSFTVEPGETLAIVGSTGSGKTTIISLLNKFYDIESGAILIDGINIKDFELSSLRRRIAVVLQDVFLFSGSVHENITMRDTEITREEVINSAKWIGADGFIERLPGQYDFPVMERGATLSMGQRQLISFARALVFNPDILVLDEATSSIDTESENIIQYAIEKLIEKRTSIIIAHRLSTIRKANKIMVLDKGKLIEFGTHNVLMKIENGQYKQLHEMQFAFADTLV